MTNAWSSLGSAKSLIAALANSILKVAGLRLIREGQTSVIDMRRLTRSPIEAVLRAGSARGLIEVPLADCRLLHAAAFPCRPNAGNPFVETLLAHRAGKCQEYAGSALEAYFTRWQPKNASDVLGLMGRDAPPGLREAEPLAYVMPWSGGCPLQALENRARMIDASHRRAGERTARSEGWKGWGPVSERVGHLEFERLLRVLRSIETRGYQRTSARDGDIGALVLTTGTQSRFLISPGHHRAAALAAIGFATAPVRLFPVVVRREDVSEWPAVRGGLFAEDGALAVFDRIFEGCPPWMAHVEEDPRAVSSDTSLDAIHRREVEP